MRVIFVFCLGLLFALPSATADPTDFQAPEPVTILGYDDHAMEPFLSRDGAWLFFNNRNQPDDETDIHYAARVDDLTFDYRGPLAGANSEDLDGVPSMDDDGNFYLISPRAYGDTRNTLWQGQFTGQGVEALRQLEGDAPRRRPFWLNIDAEVSADGQTLYFAENQWRILGGGVKTSNLRIAFRDENGDFNQPENSKALFEAINTRVLEFAPAISRDQLTLYFTRADLAALRRGDPSGFGIYVSTREDVNAPFGAPERISALTGYVEGPTLSPDECAIYVHRRVDMVFQIWRAERSDCGA